MGKLNKVYIPTVEVAVEGGEQTITVRGLSTTDIDLLLDRHGVRLAATYAAYVAEHGQVMPDAAQLVTILRRDLAPVVPTIIALANDSIEDEGALDIAEQLPAGTQAECLIEVIRLTVTSVETLKKIMWAVVTGMENLTLGMEEMSDQAPPTPSRTSTKRSGASGKKSRSASRKAS